MAIVEHRHSMEAKAPAQVQDVKAAIRFMRANAEKYNIDPFRIGIWGGSSGGHLAALVGTSDGVGEFMTEDNQLQPSCVQAVVDFSGPTDFTQMNKYPTRIDHDAEDSPESLVIGGPIQEPQYRELVQMYKFPKNCKGDKNVWKRSPRSRPRLKHGGKPDLTRKKLNTRPN